MLELNNIYLGDSYELIKQIPDKSIDCVYVDIPYLLEKHGGGKGSDISKRYKAQDINLYKSNLCDGISDNIYQEFMRICKTPNIFIWCSRLQIREILDWFYQNTNTTMNLLVWNKTNPIPSNSNWLSDVEYCLVFQEKAQFNDNYKFKSKWYTSAINQSYKKKYLHPTIKPVELVKRHLMNATQVGG